MFNKLLFIIISLLSTTNFYSNINKDLSTVSKTKKACMFLKCNDFLNPNYYAPPLGVTIAANSVCYGNSGTVVFSGTPSANVTYSVDGGVNHSILLNGTGNYTLTTPVLTANSLYSLVMISDGITSLPLTQSLLVTVTSIPYIMNSPNTTICNNETVDINFTSNVPGTTYLWNQMSNNLYGGTSGMGTSIQQTLSLIDSSTNGIINYNVIPLANGCYGNSINISVIVNPIPNAGSDGAISVSESSTTPIDLFSIITNEDAGGVWSRTSGTGGTFDATVATFTPSINATNSTFIYTITNPTTNCQNSSYANINIDAIPVGLSNTTNQTISNNELSNIVLSSLNAPASHFNWTFTATNINGASKGSGSVIAQQLSLIDNTSNGYVDYNITPVNNSATGNTFTARVSIQSVLHSNAFNINTYTISPNPFSNILNIENAYKINCIKIFNQIGQLVYNKNVNNKNITLDLSLINSGIYNIIITTDNAIINKKILKQ